MREEQQTEVLIVGVGGLGNAMVNEALERGLQVSVMVRDEAKSRARLGEETAARLKNVIIGDATDPASLDRAMQGVDVVLSGKGAHLEMARAMAHAVKRNGVQKLCWPAGGMNLMAEDGVTPVYLSYVDRMPGAEALYRSHQVCIDAIREAGINYMVFCPGFMSAHGRRSADVRSTVRINREAGMSVSYEDAAWVMLEAAVTDTYDGQLVSAATPE